MGEVASSEDGGQITATSIGKCWHLRRQMTSRGRKALSVTCGDSSPKGEPRHRILAQEMERICIDTLHSLFYGYPSMRVPPESRMVVKRFPSRHPLPLPVGEVASYSEDGERQITATSIGKCWHLRRQMTSAGARPSQSPAVTALPKGEPRHRILAQRNGAYLYRYAPFTILRLPLNACRPKVGWS